MQPEQGAPAIHPRGRREAMGLVATGLAIILVVALAVVLRLADPLSSPVVPAEDPYNHMALVREHVRTGSLEPLNEGETLYPPGLHAFLAAGWAYTGLALYDIVLFWPVVFGAVGVLGMALLMWRTAGPVAGFVSALALAVAPEAIFRSTMMSPTALDLAILPFLLYALLRAMAGRLGWAIVAAPMALFLAIAHPWLLAILAAAGLAFVILALLSPWPSHRGEPLSLRGLAACMAVLGGGLGVALLMPTFAFVLPVSMNLAPIGLAIAAVAIAPIVVMSFSPRARSAKWPTRSTDPIVVRIGLSAAIAAGLLILGVVAAQNGLPPFVDLPRMFGWPLLVLAAGAVVALPFLSSPVANLATALAIATGPFVVFNPLHSEFLSHRTAVFFGVAIAALVGVAAAALVRLAKATFQSRPAQSKLAATSKSPSRTPGRASLLAIAPTLLVATLLGGSVYAGTPDSYPGGWYRLYNSCELDGLLQVAAQADADPQAIVVTGDWQAKLVLAALTTDASRVWYNPEFFTSEEARGDLVANMERQDRPILVVMDRYLRVETPDAETSFTESPPWQPIGSWCANMGIAQPRLTAFTTETSSP